MKKFIYLFAILAITLTSCDKSDSVISLSESNKQGILTFSSIEELTSTVQKVNSMTPKERTDWESSKGFKSLGTICDKFYSSINYENFSNLDEIKSFVKTHNSQIQLVEDENGEISCVTQEYNNPERYIMNENRMYIVGNKVYRVFPEQRKVSCDIANITELAKIKDFSEISKSQYSNFEVTERSKVSSSTNSNDQYFERTEKKSIGSKNYRTIVRVEAVTLFWNSLGMPGTISYAMWYRIRNQSQFIVWWDTNASTKYAPFNYKISNGSDVFTGTLQNSLLGGLSFTVNDDDISGYIGSYPYHEPQQSTASPYIVTFDGYVYSTFTRNDNTTTITINLKYPY